GGEVHGLVDQFETADGGLADHQPARRRSERVGAAGEGAVDLDALAGDRRRDLRRRLILRNIAGLEPRHHDLADPARLQGGDLVPPDDGALLEREAGLADRVHSDAVLGLANRHRTELHDTSSRAPFAPWRGRAVFSPMIAPAVSGGDPAEMSSPIGAWMRARSASEMPCALSRSSLRACVFFEPSAPI